MPCNELPVKGLALVSGVWKVVKYWKWSPWKHRREKRSYGASGLFYPAFLRMQALGERFVCAGVDGVVTMIAG